MRFWSILIQSSHPSSCLLTRCRKQAPTLSGVSRQPCRSWRKILHRKSKRRKRQEDLIRAKREESKDNLVRADESTCEWAWRLACCGTGKSLACCRTEHLSGSEELREVDKTWRGPPFLPCNPDKLEIKIRQNKWKTKSRNIKHKYFFLILMFSLSCFN